MHAIQGLDQVECGSRNQVDLFASPVILILVFSFLGSSGGYHMGVDKHFGGQYLWFIVVE